MLLGRHCIFRKHNVSDDEWMMGGCKNIKNSGQIVRLIGNFYHNELEISFKRKPGFSDGGYNS